MELSHVFDLFDKGKFDECIISVEELKGDEKLQGEIVRLMALLEGKGETEKARTLTNIILDKNKENIKNQIIGRFAKSILLWWDAKQEEALNEIEPIEQLLESLNDAEQENFYFSKVLIRYSRACFFQELGKHDQALKLFNNYLTMIEEKPVSWGSLIPMHYKRIGDIYFATGEFNQALDSYLISFTKAEKIGSEYVLSFIPNFISGVYHILGELELSISYAQKALDRSQKIDLKRSIFRSLFNLGSANQSKGELQLAYKYFQRSSDVSKEIGYEHYRALSYYKLCILFLELNSPNQAQENLKQLKELAEKAQFYDIKILAKLAEALVLKNSNRFKEKGLAQDIFSYILEDEDASQDLRVLAVLNLCDLLIIELQTFGDEEIFIEVQRLIGFLFSLAKKWDSPTLMIEVFILQAKFALIDGTAKEAAMLLENALSIAEKKKLEQLAQKTKNEQETLKDQLNKWAELVEKNAPLVEKLEYAQIKEYIDEAIKLKEITKDSSLR